MSGINNTIAACIGFGWDRVWFLHFRLYGVIFCDENSVSNRPMFYLLQSSAQIILRFSLFSHHPVSEKAGGKHEARRGHRQDS